MTAPLYTSDDVWDEYRSTPDAPPHSCGMVAQASKAIRGAIREADRAAGATEDENAASALSDASGALNDADETLEKSRLTSEGLRARADHLDELVQKCVESMVAAEAQIQEHLNTSITRDAVIQDLTARIRRSWWWRLLDHAQAALWRGRARATARKNAAMRAEIFALEEEHLDLVNELRPVARWLNDQEWTQSETGPFGERYCSECGVLWKGWAGALPPEHDETCGLGRAARIVRRIIQREAE